MIQINLSENYQIKPRLDNTLRLLSVSQVDLQHRAAYPRFVHKHMDRCEMVLIRSGIGDIAIQGELQRVKYGDLVLYNAGVLHDELPVKNQPFEIYSMGISGLQVDSLPKNTFIANDLRPIIHLDTDFRIVMCIWSAIMSVLREPNAVRETVAHQLMLGLLEIISHRVKSLQDKEDDQRSEAEKLGMEICSFIEARFHEKLSISSISEHFNLSPYYLIHMYKRTTGYTPMQYIIKRRLGDAQEKLINSDMAITDIAMSVGYENISSFYYAFTKHIGMPPSKYRDSYTAQFKQMELS